MESTKLESDDDKIEIPNLTGYELIKKSQIPKLDIRSMVVRCTSCLSQINHYDPDRIKKHCRLGVIICKDCYEFYGTSEFSQDESGTNKYCTWCGNGGKLYLCDFCPHAFCNNCVRRNFGRGEVGKMNKEGWKCYVCEPKKLKAKIAYCQMITAYSCKAKKRKEKKIERLKLEGIRDGNILSQEWMASAFDTCDESAKGFQKKVQKLRNIEINKSKSLKHIIKKLEETVARHKTDLKNVMKAVADQYTSYINAQKEAEKKKMEINPENEKHEEMLNGETADEISSKSHGKTDSEKENGENISKKSESHSDEESKENCPSKNQAKKSFSPEKSDDSIKPNDDNYKEFLDLFNSSDDSCINDNQESLPTQKEISPSESKSKDNGHSSQHDIENPVQDPKLNDDNQQTVSGLSDESSKCEEIDDDKDVDYDLNQILESVEKKSKTKSKKKKTESESDFETSEIKKENKSQRKLMFSSSSSEKESSDSDKKKNMHAKPRKTQEKIPKTLNYDDPKLKQKTEVVLNECDNILNGKTTIPLPKKYILEDLDRQIKSISKVPSKISKKIQSENKSKKTGTVKKKTARKESSSSISLSSDDLEVIEVPQEGQKLSKKPGNLTKKAITIEDSSTPDIFSDSDSDVKTNKKSKKSAETKKDKLSDSSDDFQPVKRRKFDKLLSKHVLSDDESGSKDSKASEKENEKKADRGSKVKRKRLGSDEDKRSRNSMSSTSSESEGEKQKKKKRKRIKKPANSSSENGGSGKEDVPPDSQNTPSKGRKNIKRILSKKDLAQDTKEAQQIEKDRRKRVTDRQKLYNQITDVSADGLESITRKLVLEVDPISKEEVVEIHPDLVEKLKPHQVNGVKFMWECTIESLKELEEGSGSGCILAHCMGLGKTLQVICFIHTCLTNKVINNKIKTAMVICPYNTILNWAREFEKWLDEVEGDILVHQLSAGKTNLDKIDILKYWQEEGGVLILSYDIFRRLAATKVPKLRQKERLKLEKYLLDPGADIVICDEGHMLKNEKSGISKACTRISTRRRIILTGTPLQNNLQEYHCMLSFVKPHLLGTAKEFRNRFVNPIMNGQYEDSNDHDVRRMKKRIHIMHKLLGGCVQRCDYAALTKFLPPKHEFVISVKLSETQINMYRWYLENRTNARSQLKIQGATLFKDYNCLMNLCTHPFIVHTSFERAEIRRALKDDGEEEEEFINDESDESIAKSSSGDESVEEIVKEYKTRSRRKNSDAESVESIERVQRKEWYHEFISDEDINNVNISGKMVLLVDILKECEAIGDKLIVFSQSLLTLDCVENMLSYIDQQEVSEEDKLRDITGNWTLGVDYYRMDGGTSAELRKHFIDMFNDPLNERARLFLVSTKAGGLGTNLIGANRVVMLDCSWNPSHDVQAIFRVYRFGQKKPVYIYRLLAQGTMEEKIYDRQINKLSLSIRVVDEQQIDRHFSAADLAELYLFEPDSQSNRPTPMVPNDRILAEMLIKKKEWVVNYHEHDSLLQNETEEDLTEEERKAAWDEYENEREGIVNTSAFNINDQIENHVKVPDFSKADYEGTIINLKNLINSIITDLKSKFPNSSVFDLRIKLLQVLQALRGKYQQQHVATLRLKQEYLSKGSVPATVNKYLDELSGAVKELTNHCDIIAKMVTEETRKRQEEEVRASFQAQMAAAQANPAFANAQANFTFSQIAANRIAAANYAANQRARAAAAAAAGISTAGMPGARAYAQAGNASNPRIVLSDSVQRQLADLAGKTRYAQRTYDRFTAKSNEPVITEMVDNNSTSDPLPSDSQKSSVVITEIE